YDTYAWDTSAHTVAATNAYPMVNADTLETTGETVAVGADSRFPANTNPGATNVLLAYNSATGTSAPFYTTNAVSMVDAKFIQNGERIVYSGVNPPTPQRHYTVIQRDGTMVGDLSDPNISDVIGWQDGVIYLSGAPGAAQTLYILNTRTGLSTPPEVAWTGTAGAASLRLLQTPGNMNSTGPFTAWAQLAQTAQVVPTLVPSTPQPAASGGGRIVFPAGATSVSVQGTLAAGGMDRWVLKALGGQTMTAQLTFSSGQAILIVFGVDGSVLQSDHATSPTFSGVLPLTEDYNIDVRGNPDTATSYTLSITIPPLVAPPVAPTPTGKRIVFPAGATSVAVQGSLAPSGTDRWVLKALGGQTLTAKLTFSSGIAILIIFGADGNVLISDHAATQTFTGVLPSTQDYIIDVRNNPNSSTNYTLTITIPPLHASLVQPPANCQGNYSGQVSIAFLNYRSSEIWINGLNANCQEFHMWPMLGNNTSFNLLARPAGTLFVRIRDYSSNQLLGQYTISSSMSGTAISIQ
ncbi:MAG TPA: hypothetical protein VKQ72_23450, partial [Aggregatilineales bacterium]|nr:hypothetical protein [Aggregatilineales bacterium]